MAPRETRPVALWDLPAVLQGLVATSDCSLDPAASAGITHITSPANLRRAQAAVFNADGGGTDRRWCSWTPSMILARVFVA